MPGLSQLRQFSEDIKELGDEVRIRKMRGEQPIFVPVPDVPDVDDTQDFVLGLPTADAAADTSDAAPVDLSGLDIPGVTDLTTAATPGDSGGAGSPVEDIAIPPELADILGPSVSASGDDDLDLSEFLDDPVPPPTPASAPTTDVLAPDAPGSADDALADASLDDLLAGFSLPDDAPAVPDNPATDVVPDAVPDVLADVPTTADFSLDDASLASLGDLPSLDDLPPLGDAPAADLPSSDVPAESAADALSDDETTVPDDALSLDDDFDVPESLLSMDDVPDVSALGADDALPALDTDFSLPDDLPGVGEEAIASDNSMADVSLERAPDSDDGDAPAEEPLADVLPPLGDDFDFSGDAIDMGGGGFEEFPDDFSAPVSEPTAAAEPSAAEDKPVSLDQGELDKLFGGASGENAASEPAAEPTPADDMNSLLDGLDFDALPSDDAPSAAGESAAGGFDFPDDFGAAPMPTDTVPEVGGDAVPETFDISEIAELDFSAENSGGGAKLPFDDDFQVTGEGGDDFELTDDFEIPGFSNVETVPVDKRKGGFRLDAPDFSKASHADRPPNTLTEAEYETFKKNLAQYPLNLRVAVEDFIVKDEFKDDVIFEVIEKIVKKVSARQLAGYLEKMLDISIDVPRDYERRSVAEYEAYKQSFQYQLKNRILPAAVAGIALALVSFLLFRAGVRFIYRPVMANKLYKQGYTMLEHNEYPQSEERFEEAVQYKAVKKWFFRYAQGYREHKQYERAAQMYRNILGIFNYDKQAGLSYAEMELYDRANYARAEEIVRRDVLDHHINDADGLLLLGDTFLEWAETDAEKYERARAEYSNLIQLYGATDLYMSRMMRYFIRTDNLPNVLTLKNRFYANKKSLGAQDWTELSGYLLDKLYGNLSKSEESLRSSIEDVLDMLETAVKLDPTSPVARYNVARYFLNNGNTATARAQMEAALHLFEKAPVRTKKNTYREINGNRILGELFADNREYIKAQEAYTHGINVFRAEHERTGLEGDENTGKLFADMGDIDYFISGDMQAAMEYYQLAVENKNDTPSLNYRIGAIQYNKKDYDKALGSFIKTSETKGNDTNVLLSLGNTLSLRGDNFAAQGYYSDLLSRLNDERVRTTLLSPQTDEDDNRLVEMFLKANNNLGVTLYRLARQTGDSGKNAEALVRLSDSMRAWDALTRNPETMKRLEGSNLASQNSKYITHPYAEFEPAIYTDIPKTLSGEKGLE